jgi:hypothetical protein
MNYLCKHCDYRDECPDIGNYCHDRKYDEEERLYKDGYYDD